VKNIIFPVILAGGSGTRLWPMSREKHPKQFIPLIEGRSLFQETCLRFSNRTIFAYPTIVTHEEHRFLVRDQLQTIGITDAYIITEPFAKNTAAACLSGAYFLQNKVGDVPIIFTPADHIITKEEVLFSSLKNAMPYILTGSLCVFGINPSSPHTGYGYITKGEELSTGIRRPTRFIEKPDKGVALDLIREGAFWNSGLYFCTPKTLETEAKLYLTETEKILSSFFSNKKESTSGFQMIDKETYSIISPISIDKGIAEKTTKIILAETTIVWSDLGSFISLHEHFPKNEDGNVIHGDSVTIRTKNSYIESTSRLVAVLGLENVGVVETPNATLVFNLKESESIREIVKLLSEAKRDEIITHTVVHRPWGNYEILKKDMSFQSKKITVLPGGELSLQRHKRRAEHWVVVEGIATVTKNTDVFELHKNESTFLPMGTIHRLQNKHTEPLHLIEVQTGDYFGEDDIERFEDTYGRL
jgi:mannose-1-phosphate guanylyltransferase/mannose-6-phosphate isomerase